MIFSLGNNKLFLDYTERRKAMNRKEDKYNDTSANEDNSFWMLPTI